MTFCPLFGRLYELGEQGMWHQGPGQEFRVELGAEEEGVLAARQFGDLHEDAVRRAAGEDQAAFLELLDIFRVDFVAMAVALLDESRQLGKLLAGEI